MSLSLRPTLSALLRNRAAPLLVALQIAIALAVITNGLCIVHQHLVTMNRPTHIDEANLFGLYSAGYTQHFDADAIRREDLAWLRHLPGVIAATATNSIPLGISGRGDGLSTQPDGAKVPGRDVGVNVFLMDEHALDTLGVRLLAGRSFRSDEILPHGTRNFVPPQIIVTQAVAQKLFPHENALGRTVYEGTDSGVIIGIIDDMIGSGWWGYESPVQVAIYPEFPDPHGYGYLVRTAPGRRDAVLRQVREHLAASHQDRVILRVSTIEQNKQLLYASDRGVALFLVAVMVLLIAVTSLGIFSLATFNVSTRTRQIGTRRAVGARRRNIVQYFLVENGLITTAGVVLGCVLALAIGSWLSAAFALPRMDLYYLVGGVLTLWVLGQLAAWWPARRAAAVPPSVATRTV
jgi:putative ABC transport system permease protein